MKITIPTDISEVKLLDFLEYIEIAESNHENTDFLNLKLVEIFCGIKMKDVRNIKAKDFNDIVSALVETFKQDGKFKQRFTFGGVDYGLIPDLDDMSTGEYIDINDYLSDIQTLHKALAVLYRPITHKKGDKYLIEEYESSSKYSDVMKHLDLSTSLGVNVFFYHLGIELLNNTMDSLKWETKDIHLKKLLAESGDGIKAYTEQLKEMFLNSTASLN